MTDSQQRLLVTLLWLLSGGLGLLLLFVLTDALLVLGALSVAEGGVTNQERNIIAVMLDGGVIVLGLVLVVGFVASGEYFTRRATLRRSLRILAVTLGAEIVLLAGLSWLVYFG